MFDFLDIFFDYLQHVSFTSIVRTYWFLFFVEFPRYYLLELLVMFWMFIRGNKIGEERERARFRLLRDHPLITVLVVGKNEGKNVFKLVTSLSEQTYQFREIIVVDDGSDDDTPMICDDLERAGYIDKYLRLPIRGGKASATNYGAVQAKGKYIIMLDADSSLDRDAIENVLIPFYMDPEIKAVGGCVKVRNNKASICSTLQAVEYLKRIQVGRTVTSALGIYHIISGAFGAFETETLKKVGYWDIGPGLDGDLTQKIRKAGYKVAFAHDAICMTSVPVKWSKLWNQRIRWSRSLIRFRLRKHADILIPVKNKNWNLLNWISNMENLVYDCFLNFIWLFFAVQLWLSYHEVFIEVVVLGYLIRVAFGYLAWLMIMLMTERKREEFFTLKYVPLMSPYTGYFLRFVRLVAQTQELFFHTSYKDAWNPEKTSRYAQLEGA